MTQHTVTYLSMQNRSPVGICGSLLLHGLAITLVCLAFKTLPRGSLGQTAGDPLGTNDLFIIEGVDGGLADSGTASGSGEAPISVIGPAWGGDSSRFNFQEIKSPVSQPVKQIPAEPIPPDNSNFQLRNVAGKKTRALSAGFTPNASSPEIPDSACPHSGVYALSATSGGAAPGRGNGGATTTFLGVEGVGKSLIYVIDTSTSMHGNRLRFARHHLKESIRGLTPNQRFTVIFYNEYCRRLQLRLHSTADLYPANPSNLELAFREVDRMSGESGTLHLPGLLEARSLKLDVIYLLSNGEPELYAADLARIRRVNDGATIHAIRISEDGMSS